MKKDIIISFNPISEDSLSDLLKRCNLKSNKYNLSLTEEQMIRICESRIVALK